jgi:hypothetical protein
VGSEVVNCLVTPLPGGIYLLGTQQWPALISHLKA